MIAEISFSNLKDAETAGFLAFHHIQWGGRIHKS